ncbi:MAG: bifunctional adenosylcobinamide kinase/adenosylcobinamide-phosphate guanylyltransferase [Hungatella sp.]
MLILITGGSGSGKSAYAEQLVLEEGDAVRYYIATMPPYDEECREKILKHQILRAEKHFQTIECYENLEGLTLDAGAVVLLECLSNLTANICFLEKKDWTDPVTAILSGIRHLQKQTKTLIIVTNEVFSDGSRCDLATEDYKSVLGTVNQQISELADRVIEVVYSIPLQLK